MLKELKASGKITNDADFARKTDVKRSYVSELRNEKRTLTASYVGQIYNTFPFISQRWLLTGEGSMLSQESPEMSEDFTPHTDILRLHIVPLLPVSTQGGTLNDYVVSIKDTDCEKIASPVKADFAITVTGDSMAPEYPSGAMVLVKKIDEKAFIEWGRVYVLDTCNGTVIKEIRKGNSDEEVGCVSINTDPKYCPFYVRFADIYGVYRVIMCMSLK